MTLKLSLYKRFIILSRNPDLREYSICICNNWKKKNNHSILFRFAQPNRKRSYTHSCEIKILKKIQAWTGLDWAMKPSGS